MEKSTMSVQELSMQMGISLPKAYELTKTSGFPAFRIGTRILIPIPKRTCPKCGRDTTPSWDVNDSWYPTYNCFCGYSFTPSQLKEGESK